MDTSRKPLGLIAIALGGIGLLVSLAANTLGIGSNPLEFGWLQGLGALIGLLVVAAGVWLISTLGRALAALGILGLVLSLAANPLGIGSNPREFGWLQTLGAFLGAVVLTVGLWLAQSEK